MKSEPVLDVRGLRKSYGAQPALNGFDLQIMPGQFVALLGPNGAGKSTLFQILSGLFAPDAGRVQVNGADLARRPALVLAKIGVVFQQPTLDLALSVRGNLRFHARLHGMGRAMHARIEQALQDFGLADSAERRCASLSGGNRRKVELARALLHAPSLLLMDEATVGLDPASRSSLLRRVHALCAERGLAVLWATHLVDEAEQAQRVVILHQGRKLAEGAPSALLQAHAAQSLEALFLQLTGARQDDRRSSS